MVVTVLRAARLGVSSLCPPSASWASVSTSVSSIAFSSVGPTSAPSSGPPVRAARRAALGARPPVSCVETVRTCEDGAKWCRRRRRRGWVVSTCVAWSRRPPAGRSRALRPFPHASPSSRLAGRTPAGRTPAAAQRGKRKGGARPRRATFPGHAVNRACMAVSRRLAGSGDLPTDVTLVHRSAPAHRSGHRHNNT